MYQSVIMIHIRIHVHVLETLRCYVLRIQITTYDCYSIVRNSMYIDIRKLCYYWDNAFGSGGVCKVVNAIAILI